MVGDVRVFVAYIVLIFVSEAVTSYLSAGVGLVAHSVILVSLLVLYSLGPGEAGSSGVYLSLSLAPLIRVISLSVPLASFPRYAWYVVASVPVLVAALASMRVQGVGFGEAGVNLRKPLAQAGVALTGVPLGYLEYWVLRPEPLAPGLSLGGLALLALALVLSTGLVEELVFRGLMLPCAVKAYGERVGLVGVAAVFAALHMGWLSALDVVFVFSIGLFFGFVALRTGSIMGVSVAHGVTNVVLLLVAA